MATLTDPHSGAQKRVYFDEPATKPPPMLVVGPLAWIRNNLLKSTFDAVLTVVFGVLAISIISGIVKWAIAEANWFVITKNLRVFMVGRFPVDQSWRVEWLALLVFFLIGMALATWTRAGRALAVVGLVILVVCFGIPPLVMATTAPPVTYFAAGNTEIASGSVTETPDQTMGFIGRAGDTVKIRLAEGGDSDETLAALHGFFERSTAAVVNAAQNRLEAEAERGALEERLAGDLLTESQRTALTDELNTVEVPEPVSESLGVNAEPVLVQVLRGDTLDLIASGTLPTDTYELTVVLPQDGWYVLQKTVESDEGVTLLEADNVSPLLVSELSALDVRYRSMVSDFETSATRPQIDERDVPMMNITDFQFFGLRTFGEFMRLHFAPFLDQINMPVLYLILAVVVGFAVSRLLDRVRPRVFAKDAKTSERVLSVLLLVSPIVVYFLLAAVDPTLWGGLLLTFMLTVVGIVASFPIGVALALGRRSKLPAVKWTCILFIEIVRGVPLVSVLFIANLMLPLVNPNFVNIEGVIRAMVGITLFSAAYLAENVRGGLQSIPPGQEEAAKALGLNGIQITLFITLPQALRAVIPALVGQAISLFKDTSLVYIIGLFDLVRTADSTIAQPEFIGYRAETYLFISILYFLISYVMAYVSRRIEYSGSGQARRV